MACSQLSPSASLPIIQSQSEAEFYYQLIQDYYYDGSYETELVLLVDLRYEANEDRFLWSDGSVLEYRGNCSALSCPQYGVEGTSGNCVALRFQNNCFHFIRVDCDLVTLPDVGEALISAGCERPIICKTYYYFFFNS